MKFLNKILNRIKPLIIIVFEGFLSLIYRENCCVCGCAKDNKILCNSCAKTVEILSGFPQNQIEGVEIYSASIYKDTIKTLIHSLKFKHKKAAAKVLADFLSKYFKKVLDYEFKTKNSLLRFKNAVLVSVPTTIKNKKERGYNNVLEITKELSKLENLPFVENFLIKIKDIKPQFKVNKKQRKTNVKGVFEVNKKLIPNVQNKTVIIIDDIITTGATLGEIIKTLKENNIKNIVCITLSKTV